MLYEVIVSAVIRAKHWCGCRLPTFMKQEASRVTRAVMVPLQAPQEIDLTDPSPVVPRGWGAAPVITVGIVDEHEMFALGIRTCLAESALVRVSPVIAEDVDVVIVSPRVAEERKFAAPLVICGDPPKRVAPGNEIMAVLGRASLTDDHLL